MVGMCTISAGYCSYSLQVTDPVKGYIENGS